MGDTLHMCMHVQQREEEKDCDLVGLFVAQCFSPSGGGRAVTAEADRRKRSAVHSHPAQDNGVSPASHHSPGCEAMISGLESLCLLC